MFLQQSRGPRLFQTGSNMAASQKVEGPILGAVGCLKLIPQAELPLILQLQSNDGLTQGTSVLADHTERGTCGHDWSQNLAGRSQSVNQNYNISLKALLVLMLLLIPTSCTVCGGLYIMFLPYTVIELMWLQVCQHTRNNTGTRTQKCYFHIPHVPLWCNRTT